MSILKAGILVLTILVLSTSGNGEKRDSQPCTVCEWIAEVASIVAAIGGFNSTEIDKELFYLCSTLPSEMIADCRIIVGRYGSQLASCVTTLPCNVTQCCADIDLCAATSISTMEPLKAKEIAGSILKRKATGYHAQAGMTTKHHERVHPGGGNIAPTNNTRPKGAGGGRGETLTAVRTLQGRTVDRRSRAEQSAAESECPGAVAWLHRR